MHSQISNFFQCRSDTTKNDQINDQFLSSHLKSTYPVIKFGHLSWSFLVGFYPVTKSGHLSWSFLVSSLRIINFGHLFLSGDRGDQNFWSPGH